MLTVYRSNRAEWLANILSEQLRLTPPTPFETIEVIVNTWPTSRWLSEYLANANGISALIRFPFPGTRLRQLVKLVIGLEENNEDPWEANRLVWHIIDVLPELLDSKEATPLKEWLHERSSKSDQLNREEWQLACSIADAFDDYALYRTDEITQWINGYKNNSLEVANENNQTNWQPILMHLLSKRIDSDPFGIQVKHAIKRLKSATPPAKALPTQLNIFGLSSLAPVQIELIQALSGAINIKLFLLTPCRDLWQRCESRRERLGQSWLNPPEGDWLLKSPRLEANLGRMGAEFQQLLEGSGESQLGEWQEGDLFAAPANISVEFKKKPTLLEQLQQQLVVSNERTSLTRESADTSMLFLACPGERRQVQLVRDQILQWLANDSSLEPRDILIMTPQINRYAPLISSIFNDVAATNVELPFYITDRSLQEEPGLSQYLLQLLQLASSRLTASTLDSLLANPAIQKQQGLNQEDAIKISDSLQLTGFRWGLDAKERDGDEIHSLSWCLDRWLLGLVLPKAPGLAPGGAAPFSGEITLNELTKWWNFLSLFCNQLQELRRSHTCEEWITLLKVFAEDLFGDGGSWAWELKAFHSALEDWRHVGKICQLKLEASVVADVLNKALMVEAGRFGHRNGRITISALEPMRAIPHRVIILLGLNSDIFPRHRDRPSFHLLAQRRKLGDPRNSDQDRYVLLEALMSTRQHLMITWNSRNERTGEEIPASSPVQQMIKQLENELGKDNFEGLLRQPHPNPLADNNFLSLNNLPPISCDRRNLEARLWLNKSLEPKPLALALPLEWLPQKIIHNSPITNELLKSWLIAPQRIWLEQLQLQPKEWINPLQDLEDLNLSELQRHRLLSERFDDLIHLGTTNPSNYPTTQEEKDWVYRCAGQGILPPASEGTLECQLLEKRFQNLQSLLNKLGTLKKRLFIFDHESQEILWAGDFSIVVELGRLKSKNVIEAWLNHLQVCAIDQPPISTLVIARNHSKSKTNQYEIALQWNQLPAIQAREELNKLKSIATQGLKDCWPVPPESSWAMAKAKIKDPLKGFKAFQQKWDGGFNIKGESKAPEMQLCFGINYEATNFLNNKSFQKAYSSLYDPLIQNLVN